MNDSSTGPENWFYVRDGRRQGPFARPELVRELLALEAPEAAMVWRAGLPAWTKAAHVDELRRELPPPVPGTLSLPAAEPELPVPDLPAAEESGEAPAGGAQGTEGEGGEGDDRALGPGDEGARADEGSSETRRRRRRSSRRTKPLAPPAYVLPLVLLFLAVMVGLWLLLRRMNEVPPGRIIHQGALSGSRWGGTPA